MAIATMTSKGQITVPKEVRDELGLESGARVLFVRVGEGSTAWWRGPGTSPTWRASCGGRARSA